MFHRYVEVNRGRRHLMIISEDVGRFPQHYVRGRGWYTCLDRWTSCPFCLSDGGERYPKKARYYFDVLELDNTGGVYLPRVLLLSKSRGEELLQFFTDTQYSLTYTPFFFTKQPVGAHVEVSEFKPDLSHLKNIVRHDWTRICAPIPVDRAQEIVASDSV